ncbi:hypothetical protein ACW23B_14495 [Streptomyces albidoflavus]
MKSTSTDAAYQERDAYLAAVERAAGGRGRARRGRGAGGRSGGRGLGGGPGAVSGGGAGVAAGCRGRAVPADAGRKSRVHPAVPAGLIASYVVALVLQLSGVPTGVLAVALLLRLTGVVLLCTSLFWRPGQKVAGVLATLVVPAVVNFLWNQELSGEETMALRILADVLQLVCVVGGAAWLWWTRRKD